MAIRTKGRTRRQWGTVTTGSTKQSGCVDTHFCRPNIKLMLVRDLGLGGQRSERTAHLPGRPRPSTRTTAPPGPSRTATPRRRCAAERNREHRPPYHQLRCRTLETDFLPMGRSHRRQQALEEAASTDLSRTASAATSGQSDETKATSPEVETPDEALPAAKRRRVSRD